MRFVFRMRTIHLAIHGPHEKNARRPSSPSCSSPVYDLPQFCSALILLQNHLSLHYKFDLRSAPNLRNLRSIAPSAMTSSITSINSEFKKFSTDQRVSWIKTGKRCWRCGRNHLAAQCYLKAKCQQCNQTHLDILHEVNTPATKAARPAPESGQPATYYLDPDLRSSCVLLKMVKVLLHNGKHRLETYAILDDGSEHTILLHSAAQELHLKGQSEDLALRTIRQDVKTISGKSVSFSISSSAHPQKQFRIHEAFTAVELGLSKHSHPVQALQKTYRHLRGLPLHSFSQAQPLLLIGSDYPHLLSPVEPVHLGPPGGPAALNTRLGWTLQGPAKVLLDQTSTSQCLLINTPTSSADLLSHVSRLWQMDVLPYQNEKLITRSKQDNTAIKLLEEKTIRVQIDDVQRYATPLLWKEGFPPLNAPKEAVLSHLRGTENRLAKDPVKAASYCQEIKKLVDSGYIKKLTSSEDQSRKSWYIPHHMVHHNGKDRIVFNCSFTFHNTSLNEHLLPGPTLGSSILGVLLRFRQYPTAVSSDIKGMFHQVRLLSEDQPFLRFLWRDMNRSNKPDIYQWQVLPFGTTCSPCCATFALQRHVIDHSSPDEDTRLSVENCFYVDNLLQSFSSASEAKQLLLKLQTLLQSGGFELRQWATNVPDIISHLPPELTSESIDLWLSVEGADPPERTLGLHWHCKTDTLTYRLRHTEQPEPTMRNIYRVLAQQYDPLGLLIPYTTRAKILVQSLWGKKRDWDDPHLPEGLLQLWQAWVSELPLLPNVTINRCYVHSDTDLPTASQSIHIFSDASERAYGSVAYLRTVSAEGEVQVTFLAARSRVAPVRQQSIPRLELCAAHIGAQLGAVLKRELTVSISSITYWTDSTTVLAWLLSPSCRYKVFVGARVADIQELTESSSWRYVPSSENPADDITRGLTLSQIQSHSRWRSEQAFLHANESAWPSSPDVTYPEGSAELRKAKFCGLISTPTYSPLPDASQLNNFQELLKATVRACHGAATDSKPTAESFKEAELSLIKQVQRDCFPEEFALISSQKPIPSSSRLITLAPEYDSETQLIRVGGRLRRCESLSSDTLHPTVLDPHHAITKLIIANYDSKLAHPGPERVFSELRRRFWILRGREAVRKHQHHCPECRKWRSKPIIPKMADLPPSSLRLH
ncbi:uncharacterized protein LOC114470250 [Gouania willdenowi]|uniref:uncharacterized protein LOC114470250 n=1 Tax=Gouania willdenowi TaxID=441366 RepID=UPI0010561547|nr:uncharacterized protein LOC114470250 [Gouania willdenowi]XP_028314118.1 uncharacterized protein LOC114470250 [Gouania willdenowi]